MKAVKVEGMSVSALPAPWLLSFFPHSMGATARIFGMTLSLSLLIACETKPHETSAKGESLKGLVGGAVIKEEPIVDSQGKKIRKEASFTSTQLLKAEGQLGPGAGVILIDLKAPAGMHLTEDAPLRVQAKGKDLSFAKEVKTKLRLEELPIQLPVVVADGAIGPAEVELTYYYCEDGNQGSCRPERAHITLELDLSGSGAGGEALLVHSPKI